MKKHLFTLLLALLAGLTASAYDFSALNDDGVIIYYTVTSATDLSVEVTYGDAQYTGEVNIPSKTSYLGKEFTVTAIGDYAFPGWSGLTSVTIPDSVTSIGSYAFAYCNGLTSVTIGKSVTSIGYKAFFECSKLTAVHISDLSAWCAISFDDAASNPLIDYANLYLNGELITDLVIPDSVTEIKRYAFCSCSGLISVTIPDSVTSIGDYAFADCTNLKEVHISDLAAWCNIKFDSGYNSNPLYYAHNLYLNGELITNLVIPETITTIKTEAFYGCSALTAVTIPNSVTKIESYAFYGCSGVTSLVLGEGLKTIGNQAFYGCDNLKDVWSMNPAPPTCGTDAFKTITCMFATLHVPEGATQAYQSANVWKEFGVFFEDDTFIIVTLDKTNLSLNAGETATLVATLTGGVKEDSKVDWSTDNAAVATVDADGLVTAVAEGSAVITATCGNSSATCTVTVSKGIVEAANLSLNKTSLTLTVGQSDKLTATVTPADTTDKTVTWNSSNTDVATVDADGLVTAVAEGSAVITATCGNVSATCSVTVSKGTVEAANLSLNKTSLTLTVGQSDKLTATVTPDDTTDKTVTWSSSNTDVATVDADGLVTAVAEGSAVITATCGNVSATCTVTVNKGIVEAANLSLNKTSLTLSVGQSDKLTATVTPDDTTDKTVTWNSSNTDVATVDADGLVTAVAEGSAVITATCGNVSATCTVTVSNNGEPAAVGTEFAVDNSDGVTIHYRVVSAPSPAVEVIAGDEKYTGDVAIPASVTWDYATYSVIKIGERALSGCTNLTSVVIPESVTSIGYEAFYGCESLTSVTIPESVTSIGEAAFVECDNLKAFYGKYASTDNRCLIVDGVLNSFAPSGLTSYSIPESVTSIGYLAFVFSNLTSVTIPESVTKISEIAFSNCIYLTSVTIPESVTEIGRTPFFNCTRLSEFNGKFASDDHRCLIVDGTLNSFAPAGIKAYSIPKSVTSIGILAFYGCHELTSVTIPETVTSIQDLAFCDCKGLASVTVENDDPENITMGRNVFSNVPVDNCTLYVPEASIEAYQSAEPWNQFKQIKGIGETSGEPAAVGTEFAVDNSDGVTIYYRVVSAPSPAVEVIAGDEKYTGDVAIPATVTWDNASYSVIQIGYEAFDSCTSLTSVTIPESVTSIGGYAFWDCYKLTSMTIPNSVTSIGDGAFMYCEGLTSVTIPESVTSIGFGAFAGCISLTSVTIPESVTSIGDYAFVRCYNLKAFYGKYASADNRCLIVDGVLNSFAPSGLTSYSIPESATSIGYEAFSGCSLTSVTIPDTVTEIDTDAFAFSDLTSVTIPASVTSLGISPFCYCSDLYEFNGKFASDDHRCLIVDGTLNSFAPAGITSYSIPNSVTSIGQWSFTGNQLTSVTIPSCVTSIDEYAFCDCGSLNSVTIPASVKSIGQFAFAYCDRLSSLTVENDNPENISLGREVFYETPVRNCTLYVPEGSGDLYAAAAQWKDFGSIVEHANAILLVDGEAYNGSTDKDNVQIDYLRTFSNTDWQPLYVPFNMNFAEWSEYAYVAELYNVRSIDADNDNVVDEIVLEFNKLNSGELVPNVPYVIKPKETGTVTFECVGKELLAAPAKNGSVDCSSTKEVFTLYGVYQPKNFAAAEPSVTTYTLVNGEFVATDATTVIPAGSFYLAVTPKTGGYLPAVAPSRVRIRVLDNGEEMDGLGAIEAGEAADDAPYYDLSGRRVTNPTHGIYIHNGRKVVVK